MYDPEKWNEEFRAIKPNSLKVALGKLTETQAKIIYLRFWCDFSSSEIAQKLNLGVNAVTEIIDSTVYKVKCHCLEEEMRGALCA